MGRGWPEVGFLGALAPVGQQFSPEADVSRAASRASGGQVHRASEGCQGWVRQWGPCHPSG